MPRNGHTSFSATIRGGLPVEVEANIYPPEPDVGIFYQQVEITSITWPRRRRKNGTLPPARQVPDHLVSPTDLEQLQDLALESAE